MDFLILLAMVKLSHYCPSKWRTWKSKKFCEENLWHFYYHFVHIIFCFSFQCHINFHGLFNDKAILVKRKLMYYSSHSLGDKEVHIFSKGISSKVNEIARPEFELSYYGVAVQHVSHYATVTYPHINSVDKTILQSCELFKLRFLLQVQFFIANATTARNLSSVDPFEYLRNGWYLLGVQLQNHSIFLVNN